MTSKPLLTFALGTLFNASLCVLLCNVSHVFPSAQVSHMDCPESKSFVRGDVKIGGYVIRDNPNDPQQSAIVTYVTQVDLKGGWGRMDEGVQLHTYVARGCSTRDTVSSFACHRCILFSGGMCMYVHTLCSYVHNEQLITSASVEAGCCVRNCL